MATPCRMGCCGLSLDVTFGNRVPWKAPCKPYSGDKFVSGPDPLALSLRLPSLCRLALWVGWSGWVLGVTPLEWWVPFKISVLHSFQPQKVMLQGLSSVFCWVQCCTNTLFLATQRQESISQLLLQDCKEPCGHMALVFCEYLRPCLVPWA